MNLRKLIKTKGGFTLIELVIVIAIIAILAAILVPNMVGYLGDAKSSVCKANMETLYQDFANEALTKTSAGEYISDNTAVLNEVAQRDFHATFTGDNSTCVSTDMCPTGGTITVTFNKSNTITKITCSVHGDAEVYAAEDDVNSFFLKLKSARATQTGLRNYVYTGKDSSGNVVSLDSSAPTGAWGTSNGKDVIVPTNTGMVNLCLVALDANPNQYSWFVTNSSNPTFYISSVNIGDMDIDTVRNGNIWVPVTRFVPKNSSAATLNDYALSKGYTKVVVQTSTFGTNSSSVGGQATNVSYNSLNKSGTYFQDIKPSATVIEHN